MEDLQNLAKRIDCSNSGFSWSWICDYNNLFILKSTSKRDFNIKHSKFCQTIINEFVIDIVEPLNG